MPIKQDAKLTLIAEIPDLTHAESVAHDPNYNRLYVSVQGEQEPGDGSIATIDLEGNIIDRNFTTGLNNPKGIAVLEDWIYVSDATVLVEISRQSGEVTNRYKVGDEQSLNDVATDDKGNVYVSDIRSSSIYRLDADKRFTKWMNTLELENPNGLLAIGNDLYIGGWGSPGSENSEGNTQGRFLKVNINTKVIEKVTPVPQGNLDGIQVFDNNNFLVSDWRRGTIYKISRSGEVSVFMTSEASVGDILYIRDKKLLALPLNFQNKVLLYNVN
ncbi:hypothetical protein SAMN05192588_0944 [Nonlabens sp. Hel1_33_55]|nr:hypothetical protein SAMN05192588_0944 [Nonlabens sp. Hel1_33_55]